MTTHQDFIYSSTPVNKHLVKELGLIRGAIASKIIYTCNLKDGVCRMGQRRKAEELGIDRTTVSKGEKYLIDNKYILITREATDTQPAHLKPTKKLLDLIKTVDLINPPVDEINPPVDLITQEEESEEESESSLSKGEPPKNPKPQKAKIPQRPPKEMMGPQMNQLMITTKIPYEMLTNGTWLDFWNTNKALAEIKATAEQIKGFPDWLDRTPTLKDFTNLWGRYLAGDDPPHKFKQNEENKNGQQKQPAKRSKYADVI